MIPLRRACSAALACACTVAGLAGCSSSGIPPCSLPPAHAYALEVTTAGRVRWRTPLAAPATWGFSLHLSPLAVGAVAVFAQGDVLYGLRLGDGHRLWSRVSSQPIAGMWQSQNLVVVLTQPSRSALAPAVLTGLDASTGQARWTLRLGEGMAGFSPTADGGLAILPEGGRLEVVDLSSGRVRWTRPVGSAMLYPPVAVAGGAVLVPGIDQLTSYDDRTGQVRWAIHLAADIAELGPQASAGLVYVTEEQQNADGFPTDVLLAIRAADGRVKWRFAPGTPVSLDAYAPGLVSVTSSSGTTWQDDLAPATGRVRWQVASTEAIATPAGIVTAPDTVTEPDGSGTEVISQINMRDTLTGQTRWTAGLLPSSPVLLAGSLLIVPAVGSDGSDLLAALRVSDGHNAWQVTIPARAEAPLSAVPGGMLVYSATVILAC